MVNLAALLLVAATSRGHCWNYTRGAIAAWGTLQRSTHTVDEAKALCLGLKGCVGFTYHSAEEDPASPQVRPNASCTASTSSDAWYRAPCRWSPECPSG